jgi:uncharacterized membrane protein YphA (DoxX/SURF4 family)
MEHLATLERTLAVIFGLIVLVTALIALKNDWNSEGLENTVFKFMLALLALGAALGTLAGLGVVGRA